MRVTLQLRVLRGLGVHCRTIPLNLRQDAKFGLEMETLMILLLVIAHFIHIVLILRLFHPASKAGC